MDMLCTYLMVLHSFACHCIVLYGIAWYCIISYGIAWYCIVGFGTRAVSRKTPIYFMYIVYYCILYLSAYIVCLWNIIFIDPYPGVLLHQFHLPVRILCYKFDVKIWILWMTISSRLICKYIIIEIYLSDDMYHIGAKGHYRKYLRKYLR